MLFTLGQKPLLDDVVDLLLACHRRVLEHLALARRLADAPSTTAGNSVRDAAMRVRRYFGEAFPLHREDEEEDIFPRLLGRAHELDAAIAELRRDHAEHEAAVDGIVTVCSELEREPSHLASHAAKLRELVLRLEGELGRHLALEERTVFPAIARTAARERQEILDGMRARRRDTLAR